MSDKGLTPDELQAEIGIALPDKEVVSILDLNVDVDVLLDAASPIDLAAAAQLNVAAAIDAAAGASVLAFDSSAYAEVQQETMITQLLDADAFAESNQVSDISQTDEAEPPPTPGEEVTPELGLFEGPLLNVDVDVDVDADLAAPIAGAVAANANVGAPISASVGANVITWNSDTTAVSAQTAIIDQQLIGVADATSNQQSSLDQGTTQPATVVGSTSRMGELGGTDTSDSTTATTSSGDSSSGDSSSTGTTSSGSTSSSSGSTSGSSSSSGSGA